MHWREIGELWFLIMVANGTPVLARRVAGRALPLDFGLAWPDGRPVLGPSKTVRGLACAVAASTLAALPLRLDWSIGLTVGAAAMAGDIASSFVKRRLGIAPSGRATGLDQIPESLLPALAVARPLGLNALDVVAVTLAFFAGGVLLSKALYALRVRKRPY